MISDLYKDLKAVFIENTCYKWDDYHKGKHLFLLALIESSDFNQKSINIAGPNDFSISVSKAYDSDIIIYSIIVREHDIRTVYYIDYKNKVDVSESNCFIIDLCKMCYDYYLNGIDNGLSTLRKRFDIDDSLRNTPPFIKRYNRDKKLNNLGI